MRRRLALLVSATMALVLFAFVIPLAILVRVLVADRAVSGAVSEAQQLGAAVVTSGSRQALRDSIEQTTRTAGHPATVFLPRGISLGTPAPRTEPAVQLSAHGQSLTVDQPGGREVLVAVQGRLGAAGGRQGTAVVRIFVSNAEQHKGVARAWTILAIFGLVLLGLGVAVADRLVGTVTRPIGELARISHRLAAGDLDARASLAGPPEVREVAQGLNHLAGQVRELIWQERESVADLSHRLRTPLTALRLEAEAVPASADPDGRLTAQVAAMERAVTALIETARRRGSAAGSCDAAEVISERAAFWSVLAEDQGRGMQLDLAPPPVLVGVGAPDLAACMDVLLGNVFAHTPEGTGFTVRLTRRAGGGGRVSVEDTGPGFSDNDPVRRGASGGGSTGLGLDIARSTAEASGGSLTIRNAAGGGHVIMDLGPPQQAGQAADEDPARRTR